MAEFALFEADEDVLVADSRDYIVSNDHLCVLLCSHTQVHEIRISLIELLEGRFSLHDEVSDKGSILNGRDFVLREILNGDTYRHEAVVTLQNIYHQS